MGILRAAMLFGAAVRRPFSCVRVRGGDMRERDLPDSSRYGYSEPQSSKMSGEERKAKIAKSWWTSSFKLRR